MYPVSPTSLEISKNNTADALYLGSAFVASDLLLGKRRDMSGQGRDTVPHVSKTV